MREEAGIKTVHFVTKNDGKFREVKDMLREFGIEVRQIRDEKQELQEKDINRIVQHAALELCRKHKKGIVIEDTGIYLEAYRDFPGPFAKFVYDSLGFSGIMKLLDGMSRKAYFRTVVGYCEPGRKPVLFDGIIKGRISEKVMLGAHPCLPYDDIFIPNGYEKTFSRMLKQKQKISHRRLAFEKFARYL